MPRVATGWAELSKWIRRRVAEGTREPEATWARFQRLATRSERADILKHIVRVGKVLPDQERYRLAVSTTKLLAPLEWPLEWSALRPALVVALDALVDETCPNTGGSFCDLHDFGECTELQAFGHVVLMNARDLLRRPCRRDELPTVARLCNAGNSACLRASRRATPRSGASDPAACEQGRARYLSALAEYARAAAALNEAVGAVLFEGLNAPVS